MTVKRLIIINGAMGVGKTTVCRELLKNLPQCAFLDGDWCWMMDPFIVNEETKKMVQDNIIHLLRSYLNCSVYKNVVFCWVLHQESILKELVTQLEDLHFSLYKITLFCSEQALLLRLEKDVAQGIRQQDVISRSLERLPLYREMDTVKIDVTSLSPLEAAKKIEALLME